MRLDLTKRLTAAAAATIAVALAAAVMVAIALTIVVTGTGADPSTAFSEAQVVPADLDPLVDWADDVRPLARQLEPATRDSIEAAWISLLVDRSPQITTTSSTIAATFYSLDGQIAGLDATAQIEIDSGASTVSATETTQAVVMLIDGAWQIVASERLTLDAGATP